MMGWLSVALLAVPLIGALGLVASPTAIRPVLRVYGLVVSGITLALALVMVATFDYSGSGRMQFAVDWVWIRGLDVHFHLGVDGISLPLIALTALLTFLCFGYLGWGTGRAPGQLLRPKPGGGRPRAMVFTLLVLELGMIGTFLALDLLLFFVFFEVVLVPMYFLIAIWGGSGRRAAAIKFILYTLLGSVVMLLGLLFIWAQTGTLDIVRLEAAHGAGMSVAVQTLAFVAIGLGLAVKTPMWPLHTWLPDAHTEAPTVGSVLLAGVLLKMGTYGFARIAIPVLPQGAAAVAPWLGAFAVVGIVYGALACLAQRDLKRMIAYSSVGHMGFVLLGFATLTTVGINGALFANVAHGLITGLLFFLAGAIKERYGTADMPSMGGGMLATMPHLGSVLTFASIASLGLPGLAGFWGEMLALFGAYQPAVGLPRGLFLTYMVIGGLGAVLTAAYFLVMLSRVTHGPASLPLAGPRLATVHPPTGPATPSIGGGSSSSAATSHPGGSTASHPGDAAASRSGGAASHLDDTAASRSGGAAASHLGDTTASRSGGAGASAAARGSTGAVTARLGEVQAADGGSSPPRSPGSAPSDIRGYEMAAWVPLIVLILLFGLWPKLLLSLTTPAVQLLLGVTS